MKAWVQADGSELVALAPPGAADERRREELLTLIACRLEASTPELSARALERFRCEIPEYALAIPAHETGVRESIQGLVRLFVRVVREERRLSPAELAVIGALASERAEQGVPLEALLSAMRLAMRVGWRDTVGWVRRQLRQDDLFDALGDVAFQLLEFIDDISQAVARSYLRREDHIVGERERRRRAFLSDVLNGTCEAGPSSQTAVEFGIDICASHSLILSACAPRSSASLQAAAFKQIERSLPRATHVEAFETGHRAHVVIVPSYNPDSWAAALGIAREVFAETGLTGVYSEPRRGLLGVARDYRRLTRLLPWALTVGPAGSLRSDAETTLYGLLGAGSPEDRDEFIEMTLGGLTSLSPSQRTALLDTMQALFDHGGSPSAAGRALGVHPKTVQYRIDRVSALTGLSPRVPAERLRLDLALHLRRLDIGHGASPASRDLRR